MTDCHGCERARTLARPLSLARSRCLTELTGARWRKTAPEISAAASSNSPSPATSAQALSRQSLAAATGEEDVFTPAVKFDDAGRALVRISFDGKVPAASAVQSLRSVAGVDVIASDLTYRKGVVEA